MLLSDQYLADSTNTIDEYDFTKISIERNIEKIPDGQEYKKYKLSEIIKAKEQVIKKDECLEYIHSPKTIKDVGGNENVKEYFTFFDFWQIAVYHVQNGLILEDLSSLNLKFIKKSWV